MIESFTYQV